jgi:flagellar protein FlbD
MIELTRLNNRLLVVNSDLIKFIENTPDTVLTLLSGEKVVVSESCQAVIEKIVEFRRRTLAGLSFPLDTSVCAADEEIARPSDESTEG